MSTPNSQAQFETAQANVHRCRELLDGKGWNDGLLPHINTAIGEIEATILDNDDIAEVERTALRKLRKHLLKFKAWPQQTLDSAVKLLQSRK